MGINELSSKHVVQCWAHSAQQILTLTSYSLGNVSCDHVGSVTTDSMLFPLCGPVGESDDSVTWEELIRGVLSLGTEGVLVSASLRSRTEIIKN